MAGEQHGRGMGTACYVWIGLYAAHTRTLLGAHLSAYWVQEAFLRIKKGSPLIVRNVNGHIFLMVWSRQELWELTFHDISDKYGRCVYINAETMPARLIAWLSFRLMCLAAVGMDITLQWCDQCDSYVSSWF